MGTAKVITLKARLAAPTRFKFTVQRLKSVQPMGKTRYIYDTQQPGLCLRITKAGGKSFVYYRKIDGRPERITLGRLGSLRLDDARKAVANHEGSRALGKNPAAERRQARVRGVTVGELMKAWMQAAKARGLRSLTAEHRLWELHIQSKLEKKEAASITTLGVEKLIHRIGEKHPRTANKVHNLLRRLWNHAIKQGILESNPCHGVTRFNEQPRDRVLSQDELQRLLVALEKEPEPWRSYFSLLLFTGARRASVAAIRWQDIDLKGGVWNLPAWASKNKKALSIALVPVAVDVLKKIERMDDTWIFPANSRSGHIETPTKAWERVKKHADLRDVRIHDLRRTLGTTLAINGASAHIIAKALGHKSLASAAAYVHLDVEAARAAIEGATKGWVKP
jgi:integrase